MSATCTHPAEIKTRTLESNTELCELCETRAERNDALTMEAVYRAMLERHRAQAEKKAWDSLSRYKFQMFGYWAAIWVHMNQMCPVHQPNPFRDLVICARQHGGTFDGVHVPEADETLVAGSIGVTP